MLRQIKRVLISVSDKRGLDQLALFLVDAGCEIISSGGTARYLKNMNIKAKEISQYTRFPEMLGGRVKTLHPTIFAGLLACLDDPDHQKDMRTHRITPIDLVIVNLYPFEQTAQRSGDYAQCIEQIDVGGVSLIRAAAKNNVYVTVLADPDDYGMLMEEMSNHAGATRMEFRQMLGSKAFALTARYDSMIHRWFTRILQEEFPTNITLPASRHQALVYGENPHQKAAFYSLQDGSALGLSQLTQLHGAPLGYNNLCDADVALELVSEFSCPTIAIIKHNNPCGVGSGADVYHAFHKALQADPQSAFGGVIASNTPIDLKTAVAIHQLFVEVLIAPAFEPEALVLLQEKKKMRILCSHFLTDPSNERFVYRSVAGGLLVQERDAKVITARDLRCVTSRQPTADEIESMLFAICVCKYTKSNAIILAQQGASLGIGAGQMSRVDSVKIALRKAQETEQGREGLQGCVMASDAFFPFADGVLLAANHGIRAIIQPGGSIRDHEVIEAANASDMAMVFTGIRHFRH